jgi:hypothetical protein
VLHTAESLRQLAEQGCVVEAAVDGPGSLLNYQGHPVERLTPDRGVTNPAPTLTLTFPNRWLAKRGDVHSHLPRGVTDSHTPELPAIPTRNRLPALPSPYPTLGLLNQNWDMHIDLNPY